MEFLLFAQNALPVEASGWGAFGITGMVLSWLLLKHLPEQAKSQKEERVDFTSALRDQQKSFSDGLKAVVEHCREEMQEIVSSLRDRQAK